VKFKFSNVPKNKIQVTQTKSPAFNTVSPFFNSDACRIITIFPKIIPNSQYRLISLFSCITEQLIIRFCRPNSVRHCSQEIYLYLSVSLYKLRLRHWEIRSSHFRATQGPQLWSSKCFRTRLKISTFEEEAKTFPSKIGIRLFIEATSYFRRTDSSVTQIHILQKSHFHVQGNS
jgi:hypothetical protein